MTAQMHENLIFNGETMSMAFCPPLPHGHARVRYIEFEEMAALSKAAREKAGGPTHRLDLITGSTAC